MKRNLVMTAILSLFLHDVSAQTPQNYPTPGPEPIEINFFNVLLYVIVPLLIIVAFFWIRRSSRKRS